MPTDWRRFTGPDVSTPYAQFVEGNSKTEEELRDALINSEGKRADGRSLGQSRQTSVVRTNVISQAKGSAYIELGETKVICSVFAPREIPNKNEYSHLGVLYCEVKLAMFSCATRRSAVPEADERELSAAVRQALEPVVMRHLLPNYQVDIMVLVLQCDGGVLGAAVTAAGLALADAAMPMFDLLAAATLAVLDDRVFMDPTEAEEQACLNAAEGTDRNHGVVTLSLMPAQDRICDLNQIGSMDIESIMNAVDVLREECTKRIVPEIESLLLRNVQSEIKKKKKEEEMYKEREDSLKVSVREFKPKFYNK